MTDFLGPEDINEREREHTPSPAESFVRQAMLLSFAACLMALVLPTLAELELVVNANMPLAADAAVPFYDPRIGGGSMLDRAGTGVGEPLNVIISGQSSPEVLTESGFYQYALALGFAEECLDIHLGAPMPANLGDGHGWVNQTVELRHNYAIGGTCAETVFGGNHLRLFIQNGPLADSGALFLAVSKEEDLAEGHTITPDGYDRGRDLLVAGATGTTKHGGVEFQTDVQFLTGLLQPGSQGINHGWLLTYV